jgi:hypothetical protein
MNTPSELFGLSSSGGGIPADALYLVRRRYDQSRIMRRLSVEELEAEWTIRLERPNKTGQGHIFIIEGPGGCFQEQIIQLKKADRLPSSWVAQGKAWMAAGEARIDAQITARWDEYAAEEEAVEARREQAQAGPWADWAISREVAAPPVPNTLELPVPDGWTVIETAAEAAGRNRVRSIHQWIQAGGMPPWGTGGSTK